MIRRLVVLVTLCTLVLPTATATAVEPDLCRQDMTAGSVKNVEVLCRIPTVRYEFDAAGNIVRDPLTGQPVESQELTTAINFLDYDADAGKKPRRPARDVMFTTGRFGLKSFDISDPLRPRLLDWIGDGINDPVIPDGNAFGGLDDFWQNEDMQVDNARKLVFLSRDPRAFGDTVNDGMSGVYIFNALDPSNLRLLSWIPLPTGHTTTCINGCNWLWTAGPSSSPEQQQMGWTGGRPIIVTDIRDPQNPRVHPDAVDLFRNDGVTDYVHDVQVDDAGVAWVSGRGGVRGYWTKGFHFDPVEGRTRRATAWEPVPYAGGGIEPTTDAFGLMHNAAHPSAGDGADPAYGDLIYATEERFEGGCPTDGQFWIASLEGSYGGEAWRSTPTNPFRLDIVGTWRVDGQEGSSTSGDCSAHYFEIKEQLVAYSFYGQGLRLLDISDPTNPIQVGYFRPNGGVSFAPYWHKGLLYTADQNGVYVLRPTVAAGQVSRAVAAPTIAEAPAAIVDPLADPAREALIGFGCLIPE